MELKGKKINFLGDSITYGYGLENPETQRYTHLINKRFSLGAERNYGISGSRFSYQSTPDEIDPYNFCDRVKTMDEDADIVVVFGGTNDFGHGDADIGQMTDRTPHTFYGACHSLFSQLINRYPRAVIAVLTPMHRTDEESITGDDPNNKPVAPLITYVNVIKEVAQYYSLAVLDMYSMSGLQPRVPIIKQNYFCDGLHPNEKGNEILAERIGNFLLSL